MNYLFHKFDINEVISDTWRLFKENLGMAIVGWLLATVANMAIGVVFWFINMFFEIFIALAAGPGMEAMGGGETESAVVGGGMMIFKLFVNIFFNIIQNLIGMFITAGLLAYYIDFAKHEKAPELKTLIVWDKRVWHVILYQLLFFLIIFLVVIVCSLPGGILLGFGLAEQISPVPGAIVLGIGLLLMLGVIIYIQLALAQGLYFIIDKRVGPIDGLTLSVESMKGNKWNYFLATFLIGLISVAAVLFTCGVGMVFAAPFMLLMLAKIYVTIVGDDFIPEQLEVENQNNEMMEENFYR